MTKGTGKARKLVKALPLAVLDCMATCAAVIAAAWGTRELGEVLNGTGFAFSLIMLSAVNVVVFALARMYTTLWEYASVDELLRIVLAVTCGALIGDALMALLFDFTLTTPTYISAWAILLVVCGIAAQGGRRLLQDLFVIGDHLDRIVFPRQTRSRAEQALQQGSGDALLLFGSGDLACGCCGKGGNRLVEVEG